MELSLRCLPSFPKRERLHQRRESEIVSILKLGKIHRNDWIQGFIATDFDRGNELSLPFPSLSPLSLPGHRVAATAGAVSSAGTWPSPVQSAGEEGERE